MSENPADDVFERELDRTLAKIQECQKLQAAQNPEISKVGCYGCEKVFVCEVRSEYVSAVYKSMNKGQAGDFSF